MCETRKPSDAFWAHICVPSFFYISQFSPTDVCVLCVSLPLHLIMLVPSACSYMLPSPVTYFSHNFNVCKLLIFS